MDLMEDLTGRKAVLRERLRAIEAKEARLGRWRWHVPSCWGMGGYRRDEDAQLRACVFWLEG